MAGIVGAGQMGRGMITQMVKMKGIHPAIVAEVAIDRAISVYQKLGYTEKDYVIVNSIEEADKAIAEGKFALTTDFHIVTQTEAVDVVIDATGMTDIAAQVAFYTIMAKKHIVLLTVETDVVVGPILNKLARNAGVVYTGTAGDEPGAAKELYDFAVAAGFEVRAIGKGPNNVNDLDATPDSVREEAIRRYMNPKMLCCFKDNTKTAIELTCMSNATGCVPDIPGCHGGKMLPSEIPAYLSLKEEGGVLSKYGVVENIDGIQPGVFIMVAATTEEVDAELRYMFSAAGRIVGPNYILHRPFHLGSLETPLTAAKAVLEGVPTITPISGLVSETVTVAKKDLKAGEIVDGIGGFAVRGVVDTYKNAKAQKAVPISLITPNNVLLRDVKKGQVITYDDLKIDEETFIFQLRKFQDLIFG